MRIWLAARLGILAGGLAALALAGCAGSATPRQGEAASQRPRATGQGIKAPIYKGLYLALPDVSPRPPELRFARVDLSWMERRLPLSDSPDPATQLALAAERARNQSRARAEAQAAAKVRYTIVAPTGVVNVSAFYSEIEKKYKVDPQADSPAMAEFKALKTQLDAALRRSGYTEAEIQRFYVLNYMKPSGPSQPGAASRSGS